MEPLQISSTLACPSRTRRRKRSWLSLLKAQHVFLPLLCGAQGWVLVLALLDGGVTFSFLAVRWREPASHGWMLVANKGA